MKPYNAMDITSWSFVRLKNGSSIDPGMKRPMMTAASSRTNPMALTSPTLPGLMR